MTQFFKKAAIFTDLHFGKKNNQRQFNIDCENFVIWFIEEARAWGAETCIFLGDWHDNRRFVNVSTLNYSISNLERLDKSFDKTYILLGNHDLYYREKREINSIEFARNLTKTKIINEITLEGDCAFVPWLIGDEFEAVKKLKAKYMFGHFELPTFLMNAMSEMPDKGELQADDLSSPDYVFSGHFHKRQRKGNIWYIGNAFPHNYGDSWEDERGMMFLEWGKEPEFKSWPDQPRYINIKLSDLLEAGPENLLNTYTYARIMIDIPISYEEAQYLRESFSDHYGAREVVLVPQQKTEEETAELSQDVTFKTVDQIVVEGLSGLEAAEGGIDHKLLIDLYNALDVDHL